MGRLNDTTMACERRETNFAGTGQVQYQDRRCALGLDHGNSSTIMSGTPGVQVVQRSRYPRRDPAARGVQFPVPIGVLGHTRVVIGAQVFRRPTGEAA
jgi:hypothetical protein